MQKYKIPNIFIFFFLSLVVFLSVYLVGKNQLLQKYAEEKITAFDFNIFPEGKLNRVWPYFAQGGEEHKPMLAPANSLIQALQPRYLRIDHLYDFPDLDARVEEILQTGAKPFFALSYFPPSVSAEITTLPADLTGWQNLVQQTIQEYSGKKQKNLLEVYYEVWNEPDLFGQMTPEQYYRLYRASVLAAENCQDCNAFKIGGPAITTLKKDWLDKFLLMAGENKTRLDFVSWHSYQANPEKTKSEARGIRVLAGYKRFFPGKELIISEWGPTPEISGVYDSLASASHAVTSIEKLRSEISKVFTFELVDGIDQEGKKYWGRWGLFTNPKYGLTAKPRYYTYLYLNKLLEYELKSSSAAEEIAVIGSTDARENFSFLLTAAKAKPQNFDLRLKEPLPGTYQINSYFLDNVHEPLAPESQILSVNKDLKTSLALTGNAVILLEINRTSPALITEIGRTNLPSDSSAKLAADLPPLTFFLSQTLINQAEASFWFKSNRNDQESQKYIFLESKNPVGDGITAWYENSDGPKIIFSYLSRGETSEQVTLPIEPLDRSTWRDFSFSFDNNQKIMRIACGGKESISPTTLNLKMGDLILIGGSNRENNSAEGAIDDLSITINQEILYLKNFD